MIPCPLTDGWLENLSGWSWVWRFLNVAWSRAVSTENFLSLSEVEQRQGRGRQRSCYKLWMETSHILLQKLRNCLTIAKCISMVWTTRATDLNLAHKRKGVILYLIATYFHVPWSSGNAILAPRIALVLCAFAVESEDVHCLGYDK